MDEPERPALPPPLRAAAILAILFGIGTLLTMIVDLTKSVLNLNFGVLQIPAGFGILRLSRGWRTFQLVILWLGMIGFAVAVAALLCGGSGPPITMFGSQTQKWSREVSLVMSVLSFGLLVWQYRVLTSPRVRRLFGLLPPRS
ncbi:MAG: hypothetical protein HY293_13080 [Planctomycetes bacterium]|nr:hypothetical protein [Planctomycetota bacterium]